MLPIARWRRAVAVVSAYLGTGALAALGVLPVWSLIVALTLPDAVRLLRQEGNLTAWRIRAQALAWALAFALQLVMGFVLARIIR